MTLLAGFAGSWEADFGNAYFACEEYALAGVATVPASTREVIGSAGGDLLGDGASALTAAEIPGTAIISARCG